MGILGCAVQFLPLFWACFWFCYFFSYSSLFFFVLLLFVSLSLESFSLFSFVFLRIILINQDLCRIFLFSLIFPLSLFPPLILHLFHHPPFTLLLSPSPLSSFHPSPFPPLYPSPFLPPLPLHFVSLSLHLNTSPLQPSLHPLDFKTSTSEPEETDLLESDVSSSQISPPLTQAKYMNV